MFDFTDNEQFSNLDCMIVQLGRCEVVVANEVLEDSSIGKKLRAIFDDHDISVSGCKKALFKKPSTDIFEKLGTAPTHVTNSAEVILLCTPPMRMKLMHQQCRLNDH